MADHPLSLSQFAGRLAANMANGDLQERFWAKVDRHGPLPERRPDLGPCWQWTAAKFSNGYGLFNVSSVRGREVRALAHRVAYLLLVGPIPQGLEPDHLCRNRPCVKSIADERGPAHLELVTRRENLLRGDTIPARHAAKTHCPKGHPYDEANTYRGSRGERRCRACTLARNADYLDQHRAERAAYLRAYRERKARNR